MTDPQQNDSTILLGLDEVQAQAVASSATPLCVLAGAGSGKTRVLTRRVARRIADGSADAAHCVVLTFTRKAADELRERLHSLGIEETITVGTFHAIAYAELRRRWIEQDRPVPVVTSQPLRILEAALGNLNMTRIGNVKGLLHELTWAKSQHISADDYDEAVTRMSRRPPLSVSHMARVYKAYELEKRKRRVLDFDDLLLLLSDAINREKPFAAAQRWRFRHFFVDEFQDLNQAQFDLLRSWLGGRDDLFVVGDPNQAIYGWNGADATFLTDIDRWYPGIEKIRLTTNYRSTPQVLAAASAILPNTFGRHRTQSAVAELPAVGEAPTLRAYPDELVEAAGIARHLRLVCSGSKGWGDAAVLVRTNAQRAPIEAALAASSIPFRSAGGVAWLYRAEVREALELLRQVPHHRLVERLSDVEQMALESEGTARELLDDLADTCRLRVAEDPNVSISDFLSWIEVASRFDGPPGQRGANQAVTVSTFHRAKGLEWPVVFLAGLEDGLVPFGNPSERELQEERRLFYVALTRAREELHCSFAAQRTGPKGVKPRKPSPWLTALAEARLPDDGPSPEVVHQTLLEGRAALAKDPVAIDPARTSIERWRTSRAQLTGIEPRLILADQIIDAIVDLRPTSKEELASVDGFGSIRAAAIGDEILALVNGNPT